MAARFPVLMVNPILGSYDKPTFQPSLLINKDKQGDYPLCHTFITDGKIQFLVDCTHALAGQTIEMEDA